MSTSRDWNVIVHATRATQLLKRRLCNSQNPHLTNEVQLHPVKAGVWSAVKARRNAWPAFFNETINCERYEEVIFRQFFP
jgi:hypothetical protein